MGFDVSKVRSVREELDVIERRTDLGAVRAASAALGLVDVRGVSAALEATRRLQAGSLGAGLGSVRSFGALDASVKQLAQGATALAGLPRESTLSVAAEIARKPPPLVTHLGILFSRKELDEWLMER